MRPVMPVPALMTGRAISFYSYRKLMQSVAQQKGPPNYSDGPFVFASPREGGDIRPEVPAFAGMHQPTISSGLKK